MTDRKLTEQQHRRIDAATQERLASWLAAHGDDAGAAVVVSHLRGEVEVQPAQHAAQTVRCHLRSNLPTVVAGDRVLWEPDASDDARGVITAVLPRSTLLSRHAARGLKPVCANLDLLLVTIAVEPEPHGDLIDRYLLAAHLDAIEPVLLLNKADLGVPPTVEQMLDVYRALGIEVHVISTVAPTGLDALRARLAGRAAAFVGQSGVGKSSLLNALHPSADAETGGLSAARNRGRARGRHTTSTTRLYPVGDGVIIDSPGIREFVADVSDPQEVLAGFPEIADAAAHCRFSDCRHEVEPGCAVQDAVQAGDIAASRLDSFHALTSEAEARAN